MIFISRWTQLAGVWQKKDEERILSTMRQIKVIIEKNSVCTRARVFREEFLAAYEKA